MEASGFSPEDFGDDFEVWPENHDTFHIFERFQNQWLWVAGMGGAVRIGLNIGVLPVFIDRLDLSDVEYNDLLDDLQAMERAALNAMNE